MIRRWADLKTTDFAALDQARTIAILPTAAIEQHGPHLPVSTDVDIGEGTLRTLEEISPHEPDLLILPIQAVGKSNEHLHAAGTLTIPAALAIELWTEIGLSVARAGVRRIAIVNSHGGNVDVISIVARELRVRAGMLCGRCSWMGFGLPEGLFSERERDFGIHGGDVETSLMLHFRPDLVDMARARDFASSAEAGGAQPIGAAAYGWIASDLNPQGVVGEASKASAEKGRATALHQAKGLAAFLSALARAQLAVG